MQCYFGIVIPTNLYSDQLMHIIYMFSRYGSAWCKKFVLSAQCLWRDYSKQLFILC